MRSDADQLRMSHHWREWFTCLMLVMLTAAAYAPVYHYGFVNFDDPFTVTENSLVQKGLTWEGVRWAFTTNYFGYWRPLIWLSHMVDCQLFGMNAGAHHLVNLGLHIINALLVFWVFRAMTGAVWRSGFVAALFALHPLHVESVAWITERKDVLSTLFWLLAMWAYVWYTRRQGRWRYAAVMGCFALGLMAKPMVMTLPCVLLLMDVWPLRRLQIVPFNFPLMLKRVAEKLPLFALVLAAGVVTFVLLRSGTEVSSTALAGPCWTMRYGTALVSYVRYISMTLWPADLAAFYPYPAELSPWSVLWAALLLAGVTFWVIREIRAWPYLAVGWLWYLGTLVPAIGLLQVGDQAMADRFTYIPLIGLFVMAAWGFAGCLEWARRGYVVLAIAATVLIVASGLVTRIQVRVWQDSVTLFQHALAIGWESELAHYNLARALTKLGRNAEAVTHYRAALRLNPDNALTHNNLGVELMELGQTAEAVTHYREALRLNPNNMLAQYNLGLVLATQGETGEAMTQYRKVLSSNPSNFEANFRLGIALARTGNLQEAITHFRRTVEIKPESFDAQFNLATTLAQTGKLPESIEHYEQAVKINPDGVWAHFNLAMALQQTGKLPEAIRHFEACVRIKPSWPNIHYNLGLALAQTGKLPEAIGHYTETVRLSPDFLLALDNLAWIRATDSDPQLRNGTEAVRLAEHACQLSGRKQCGLLDTLAAAYAEVGKFAEAVTTAEEAIALAKAATQQEPVIEIQTRLNLYRAGKTYRETRQKTLPERQ